MGALDTPTTGRAIFQGRDLQTMTDRERSLLRRTKIGFVFQAFNLLPTLTAAENEPTMLAINNMVPIGSHHSFIPLTNQPPNAGLQLRRAISTQAEWKRLLEKNAIAPSAARLC